MNILKFIIVLIWSSVWLVVCVLRPRSKSKTVQKINKAAGEAIAVDHLIQKYEKEHQTFYEEEIGDDDYLEWPALNTRSLSDYCRKFLQHSVPGRNIGITIGSKIKKELHYKKENTRIVSNIVILHCKFVKNRKWSYYMTRAPEPNCAYAVKCSQKKGKKKFSIIHKYCDFEGRPPKRKRTEIIGKMHRLTGQPIAKDEYLLEYELDHQKLFKQYGEKGMRIYWPHAVLHSNLDSFCYQYLGECVPGRTREILLGSWQSERLNYQKLNTNETIEVTTVTCRLPSSINRRYHITRALETNCVYALLRKNRSPFSPLIIIFKHCDFENTNDQQPISKRYNSFHRNLITKIEVKDETFDTLETQLFFPKD